MDNNISRLYWLACFASILLIGVGAWIFKNGFAVKTFPTQTPFDVAQDLLLILAILSVFLERALEVYVTTWRKPGRRGTEIDISDFVAKLDKLNKQQDEETDSTKKNKSRQEIHETKSKLHDRRQDLDKYRAQTLRIMCVVMVLAAIIISAIGPRVFSSFYEISLIDKDSTFINNLPVYIANFMDILITAGLIAGGAKGFNKVSLVMASFSETLNTRAKGTAS